MNDARADRDAGHLAEAQEYAKRFTASLPDRIQIAALKLKSKLSFKVLSIRELLLDRVTALSSAAVDLFAQKRVIPAVILTRAIVETLAVLFTFYERLDRFLKEEPKDIVVFDELLMRYLMGARNNPEMPTPTNIVTLIDRVEKAIPGFRQTYDSLCECAHPNWAGMFGAFGELGRENFELKLRPTEKSFAYSTGLAALSISLKLFEHYYNNSANLVHKINDYFEGLPT